MAYRRNALRRLKAEEERAAIKVNVVGVGGCGNNCIGNLAKEELDGVKRIAVNTDAAVLRRTEANARVLIGQFTHKGRGARGVPMLGRESIEESIDEVLATIDPGLDLLVGVAGMGGGTGTGALPVLLREAGLRNGDAVKVAVVTLPFAEEGLERRKNAQLGLTEVLEEADMTIVNANDLVLSKARGADMTYAFKTMDKRLARAIAAIIRMQSTTQAPGVVNVDFSNFQRIAKQSGIGFIGVGSGPDPTYSLEDSMRDDYAKTNITGANGGILYFEASELDLNVTDVRQAANNLRNMYAIPTIFIGLKPIWGMKRVRTSLIACSVKSEYVDNYMADLGV